MSQFNPNGLSIAAFSATSSGDATAVPAFTNRVIAVHRIKLLMSAVTTLQFKDGTTALSGPEPCAGQNMDYSDEPYYLTTAGNAFVISLGAAVQCGGSIWYRLQP